MGYNKNLNDVLAFLDFYGARYEVLDINTKHGYIEIRVQDVSWTFGSYERLVDELQVYHGSIGKEVNDEATIYLDI